MSKLPKIQILLALLLSGCITQPVNDPSQPSELEQVAQRIESIEKNISLKIASSCDASIKKLDQKIEDLRKAKETTKVVERCSNKKVKKSLGNKLLLGAVERVRLSNEALILNARIDTGAETSSIGVFNLKPFERDGDNWVRFSLNNKKNARVYEYPVFDKVKIKQSGSITDDRIEIKMNIQIGDKKYKKQIFNLANRSFLDYRLLIGRSFLRDIAIVDVSRKYLIKLK
jgi:hypothetical protein